MKNTGTVLMRPDAPAASELLKAFVENRTVSFRIEWLEDGSTSVPLRSCRVRAVRRMNDGQLRFCLEADEPAPPASGGGASLGFAWEPAP